MPGLVPGIHVFLSFISRKQDVDGRDKPGHDGAYRECVLYYAATADSGFTR
jgi:hypothetical protein